jgi:hypothetical protein
VETLSPGKAEGQPQPLSLIEEQPLDCPDQGPEKDGAPGGHPSHHHRHGHGRHRVGALYPGPEPNPEITVQQLGAALSPDRSATTTGE